MPLQEPKLARVLFVESCPLAARSVFQCVSASSASRLQIDHVDQLHKALESIRHERFDAVLLNLFLSDGAGLNTLEQVHAEAPTLPIVVLTGAEHEPLAMEAVRQGAQDYLVRSRFDGKGLARAIGYAIGRKRVERRLLAQYSVACILAESASLTQAAPRLLQAACESLDWDVGVLWRINAQNDRLRFVATYAPPQSAASFLQETRNLAPARGEGLPGQVWSTGNPFWIEDLSVWTSCPRAEAAARDGFSAACAFPIRLGAEILGVAEFFACQIPRPDTDLLQLMATLGGQIGQFIVRKDTEEKLAAERNLLRGLIDNATAVIYLKDLSGHYQLINRPFEELFHVKASRIAGQTDHDLFPHAIADAFRRNDERVVTERTALEFEESAPHDDGLRTYISIKFPLCNPSGAPYAVCGISTDITARKRAEEEIKAANTRLTAMNTELAQSEETLRLTLDQLRQSHDELKTAQQRLVHAAQLESIGRLAACVAHEVKNPLQTILMGLAFLDRNRPAAESLEAGVLDDMRTALQRADGIVRDLLQLASPRPLDLALANLNEIIEQSLLLVNFQLNKAHVDVNREFAPNLPQVLVDRPRLQQVFINLITNAVQAMPEGGPLTIRTRVAPEEAHGPRAVVEVEDAGTGIPLERLQHVFEPFETSKPSGSGTGLGLPITKQIVESHGGTIELHPRRPNGICARVTLNLP